MKNDYKVLRTAQTKIILVTSIVETAHTRIDGRCVECLWLPSPRKKIPLSSSSEWQNWWITKCFI